MNDLVSYIEYDGAYDAVFTHRTQTDTIAGNVWRFILDGHRTLVVTPCQTESAPAMSAHVVPARIESLLVGEDERGRFAYAVNVAALVSENNAPQNWEGEIEKATDREFTTWRNSKQRRKVDAPEADKKETRLEHDREWEKIEILQREKIEKEKTAYMNRAEAAAMKELAEAVASYGVKRPGAAAIKALYSYIREEECDGNTQNPALNADAFRRIADKAGELIGAPDFAGRVMLAYSPDMPKIMKDWTERTAKAEGIGIKSARAQASGRIRFMAIFPDGKPYPVESFTVCIHDAKDSKAFRRIDVSPGDRGRITAAVDDWREKKTESRIHRVHSQQTETAQRRLVRKSICLKIFNITEYQFRKGLECGLYKPVPSPTGGKPKYDIDEIMTHHSPALDDEAIKQLLTGMHRK